METIKKVIETESEPEILTIKISITTSESEKFIDELEKLCEKFSIERDYFFNFK